MYSRTARPGLATALRRPRWGAPLSRGVDPPARSAGGADEPDSAPDPPRHETCRVRSSGMSTENPRDASGEPLCVWCGGEIKQSGVGRRREYCSRTHREYAYRARREANLKLRAYIKGRADERLFSSTDVNISSTDETKTAGQPTDPLPAHQVPAPAPPAEADPRQAWTWSGLQMLPVEDGPGPDGQPRRDPYG